MDNQRSYAINTEVKFGPGELIDVGKLHRSCTLPWFNQTLCRVNDCVVRLGVVEGEFHWHVHEQEDEFFYVVQGRLFIDLESRTEELAPEQGFLVTRGVRHRTRAPQRTVMLMIEGSTVKPTGD